MNDIVKLEIWQFSIIYLLLIVVVAIMRICKINQTKLLLWASVRMTVQLTLAGFILMYIFEHPHIAFTVTYVIIMVIFSIYRVLSRNKMLNYKFKIAIVASMAVSGLTIISFFVTVIVGESLFNPQYVIPLSGMIMGNTMTGVNLGIKTFRESYGAYTLRLNTLLNCGAKPSKILMPLVNQSLETALLPTMNNMLGMGIVSLPGMMTGQILAGAPPTTAILYQIAIMIAIVTVVCLAVFSSLFFGYRTMYNKSNQFIR